MSQYGSYVNLFRGRGYLNETQWEDKKRSARTSVATMGSPNHGVAPIADDLAKLASLREKGVLTAEEFDKQKQRVLA